MTLSLHGGVSLPTTILTTIPACTCMQARGFLLAVGIVATCVAPSRIESAHWNMSGSGGALLVGIGMRLEIWEPSVCSQVASLHTCQRIKLDRERGREVDMERDRWIDSWSSR